MVLDPEELEADATLLGVDAGVITMMAMSKMYVNGDTRDEERVLNLRDYRQMTRLRGKLAAELNRWRKENARLLKLIRVTRGCSPSRRTMNLAEHEEWIETECSIAPEVWGMLTGRVKQRVRFERYRLRCSVFDKLLKLLFPLPVSSICDYLVECGESFSSTPIFHLHHRCDVCRVSVEARKVGGEEFSCTPHACHQRDAY